MVLILKNDAYYFFIIKKFQVFSRAQNFLKKLKVYFLSPSPYTYAISYVADVVERMSEEDLFILFLWELNSNSECSHKELEIHF